MDAKQRLAEMRAITDALWDLRDDAFDHPDRWSRVTAEQIFQALAATTSKAVDEAREVDWPSLPSDVRSQLFAGPEVDG